MALAFGIAAALLKRNRTGAGSIVDVSLLATAMWMLSSDLLSVLNVALPRRWAVAVRWLMLTGNSSDERRPPYSTDVPAGDPGRISAGGRPG